jgi:hypothetical protein
MSRRLGVLIHSNDFQLRCGALSVMIGATSFTVSFYNFLCVPTNIKEVSYLKEVLIHFDDFQLRSGALYVTMVVTFFTAATAVQKFIT